MFGAISLKGNTQYKSYQVNEKSHGQTHEEPLHLYAYSHTEICVHKGEAESDDQVGQNSKAIKKKLR